MSSLVTRLTRLRFALPGLLALSCTLCASASALAGGVEVFAEFASGAGKAGVREVRMWVDGKEVTDRSAVSSIRISYALPGDFPTGAHEARVQVVDALGRTHEKSWSFEHEAGAPELVAFFSDELVVELDDLPRRFSGERVRLSGSSQPDVEIEVRVDGGVLLRTGTSATGRFAVTLRLDPGAHEIGVAALRPWTGEEGREARLRLERVLLAQAVEPRDAPSIPNGGRAGREAPDAPEGRSLPGDDDPNDDDPGDDDPAGPILITKPDDGDVLRNDRVAVLGLAPAGWRVEILVDGVAGGSDVANPAGRFTVAQVRLAVGTNELIAEAEHPESGQRIRSEPVVVELDSPHDRLLLSAARSGAVARDGRYRVEGRAWPGATLEVELNGRLVGTESAAADGRFAFFVPVERGLNQLVVEAFDLESGRSERSAPLRVRGLSSARRVRPALGDLPPLERPELPGRGSPVGSLGRVKPLR